MAPPFFPVLLQASFISVKGRFSWVLVSRYSLVLAFFLIVHLVVIGVVSEFMAFLGIIWALRCLERRVLAFL